MPPSKPLRRGYLVAFFLTSCFLSLLVHIFGPSYQRFFHLLRERAYDKAYEYAPLAAVVVLNGPSAVNGTLKFWQKCPDSATHITGIIQGLDKNTQRGAHVHVFGDLTNGCGSSGLHYNPHNVTHGGGGDDEVHVGDLGNILSDDQGVAHINIWSKKIQLFGDFNVIGHTLVVHDGTDDLGTKRDAGSLSVGNSGGRSACGVIGFTDYLGFTDPSVPM